MQKVVVVTWENLKIHLCVLTCKIPRRQVTSVNSCIFAYIYNIYIIYTIYIYIIYIYVLCIYIYTYNNIYIYLYIYIVFRGLLTK